MRTRSKTSRVLLWVLAVGLYMVQCCFPGTLAGRVRHAEASPAGHWAEQVLAEALVKELLRGYPDGSVMPDKSISRVEFCAVIVRMAGQEQNAAVARRLPSSFVDVEVNYWGKGYLEVCREVGILRGIDGNCAAPEREITRAEAATMLDRYLSTLEFSFTFPHGAGFSDASEIPGWARMAVERMSGLGMVVGDAGRFRASSNLTRAEAVTMLLRLQGILGKRWDMQGTFVSLDGGVKEIHVQVQGETLVFRATDPVVFARGKKCGLSELRSGDVIAFDFSNSSGEIALIVVLNDGTT